MKVASVIAEFNPLHKGHEYLLREAKSRTGADALIIIMSGNFVQRGTPAFMSEALRTEAALLSGADLVLELPLCYATSSIDDFASGAVFSLADTGIVDTLVFGCENDDLALMQRAAALKEDAFFHERLLAELATGVTYPAAYAKTILANVSAPEREALTPYFSSPNNLLGLFYLRANDCLEEPFTVQLIKREGAAYHDAEMDAGAYASATALRASLCSDTPEEAFFQMPEAVRARMQEEFHKTYPIEANDLSGMLFEKLTHMSYDKLISYAGVTNDLARRILDRRDHLIDFESFIVECKTKQITQVAVQRALLHILLDVDEIPENPPYLRVLGLRGALGKELLASLCKNAAIPVVTSLTEAEKTFAETQNYQALRLLEKEIRADDRYRYLIRNRYRTQTKNAYQRGLIILN